MARLRQHICSVVFVHMLAHKPSRKGAQCRLGASAKAPLLTQLAEQAPGLRRLSVIASGGDMLYEHSPKLVYDCTL